MGQRGRSSGAALSVVAGTSIDGRPPAPSDLTQFQREVWDRTVANESADTFKTAALQQLLRDYCRHVETAGKLSKIIEAAMEPSAHCDLDELTKLVRLRDCETKASADKATKLRLTNQSRYTPQAAGTAAKKGATTERKPWHMTG
jgi:hypothetical protein